MTSYDYTAEVFALQNARGEMQAAKAKNRIEITAQYKARIDNAIKEADRAVELHFAKLLKEANEAGVPQSIIRRDVLRTNVWSRWTYWRDLAEITPDRVTLDNAKEERNKKYKFEKFNYRGTERDAILWLKDKKGKTLDTALRAYVVWDFLDFPDLDRDQEDYRKSVGYGFEEFTRMTGAIIKEHYEGKEQGE